ncbi:MAG: ADP-ribosylation factor-like protein [Chitinivibrionales bacterium]
MATINYAVREISVKIVYYGTGLCGKTTNLQVIHRKIPNEHRSDMVSLATETDRTLFFDFLPLDLGKIKGFSTKFQLYTVPGQVYYNATRKLVLRGVDGVVFVVDSAPDKLQENIESFKNLEENLAEYGYQRENIPIIIQYNKRDLPNALPVDKLNSAINKYGLPWNECIAVQGRGIFESLKIIGKMVIDNLNKKYSRPSSPQTQPQTEPFSPPASPRPALQSQRQVFSPTQPQQPMQPVQRQPTSPQQPFSTPSSMAAASARQTAHPPVPNDDPFQDSTPRENSPRNINLEPQQQTSPFKQPVKSNDYYDYSSINLEPMAQQPIPEGIEVISAQGQRQGSIDKTDLDLEIERYQREIDDKQRKQRQVSSPQQPHDAHQPFSPSAPRAESYEVYEPISPPKKEDEMPSYQSPRTGNDQSAFNDVQPLYFTSMNPDRQKKKVKKPVNPKNRSQGSFLSKFFNKDKP